ADGVGIWIDEGDGDPASPLFAKRALLGGEQRSGFLLQLIGHLDNSITSALDDTDRAESCDLRRDAEVVHDVDDVLHVLVGLRHLLGEGVAAGRSGDDAVRSELVRDAPSARGLDRRRATEQAAGATT